MGLGSRPGFRRPLWVSGLALPGSGWTRGRPSLRLLTRLQRPETGCVVMAAPVPRAHRTAVPLQGQGTSPPRALNFASRVLCSLPCENPKEKELQRGGLPAGNSHGKSGTGARRGEEAWLRWTRTQVKGLEPAPDPASPALLSPQLAREGGAEL